MNNYDDIIDLPHHVSSIHRPMSMESRAAQFAPFAALSGYNDAIVDASRLTGERIFIDDDFKDILNEKLLFLLNNDKPFATFTYFVSDESKSGGSYKIVSNYIKKIDLYNDFVVLVDGVKLPISDIIDITSDLFDEI